MTLGNKLTRFQNKLMGPKREPAERKDRLTRFTRAPIHPEQELTRCGHEPTGGEYQLTASVEPLAHRREELTVPPQANSSRVVQLILTLEKRGSSSAMASGVTRKLV